MTSSHMSGLCWEDAGRQPIRRWLLHLQGKGSAAFTTPVLETFIFPYSSKDRSRFSGWMDLAHTAGDCSVLESTTHSPKVSLSLVTDSTQICSQNWVQKLKTWNKLLKLHVYADFFCSKHFLCEKWYLFVQYFIWNVLFKELWFFKKLNKSHCSC